MNVPDPNGLPDLFGWRPEERLALLLAGAGAQKFVATYGMQQRDELNFWLGELLHQAPPEFLRHGRTPPAWPHAWRKCSALAYVGLGRGGFPAAHLFTTRYAACFWRSPWASLGTEAFLLLTQRVASQTLPLKADAPDANGQWVRPPWFSEVPPYPELGVVGTEVDCMLQLVRRGEAEVTAELILEALSR